MQLSKQGNASVADGLRLHQQQDLAGAERAYLAVLAGQPNHADAMHLLGVLRGQQGLCEVGADLIQRAIAQSPRVSAYHNNLGNLKTKTRELTSAEDSYRRALKIDANNAQAHLNLGKLLEGRGLLVEARRCFISSLRIDAKCLEAHMSLGRLDEVSKKYRSALQSYTNAVRISPRHAPAHLAMGNAHKELGAAERSEESYRLAIAMDPGYGDAYFNLANMLRSRGDLSGAVKYYRQSIELSTGSVSDAYNNLGLTLADLGQEEDAMAAFLKTVELDSTSATAWFNLGAQDLRSGNQRAAEEHLRSAIALGGSEGRAHVELGNLCRSRGDLEEACELYRQAILASPCEVGAYNNLGATLSELNLHEEAQEAYRKALALRPDHDVTCFNLGKELSVFGDEEEGFQLLHKAILLNPANAAAHLQIGVVLQDRGFLEEASQFYSKCLQLENENSIARSNLGLVLALLGDTHGLELLERVVTEQPADARHHWSWGERLLLHGRYEQGWAEYEWRMQVDEFLPQHRTFEQPRWRGEPLEGRTILLYAEQGQGDTLQFCRYCALVAARGGKVILEVQGSLRRLLASLPGVSLCIEQGSPLPEFSVFAPLMSLPYIMDTRVGTIPAPAWLQAAEVDRATRTNLANLQVGIVWAGNPKDKRDRLRSSRLSQWGVLADIPGVEFTSLQTGEATLQMKQEGQRLTFSADCAQVRDFLDTAAIIAELDLVITVDTAVAHLAGSMGKPVWILIYNPVDWRWGLSGSETAWYPTARLFRQTTPADWTSVLNDVAVSLRHHAQDSRQQPVQNRK